MRVVELDAFSLKAIKIRSITKCHLRVCAFIENHNLRNEGRDASHGGKATLQSELNWVCARVANFQKRLAIVEKRQRPLSLFPQGNEFACVHC